MKDNGLSGEKTIALSIAHEILTTSLKIPHLPANGTKIMDMARQPKETIDIPSFAKLVESDPGLLVRILQLANSPVYSEIEKISSLRAAITRVGLTEIVDSVLLYFFQKMLPEFPTIEGFTYKDFWNFSWACGVANRRLGHPNLEMGVLPGDLYMTGLLHGIGKLLLAIHMPEDFSKSIRLAQDKKIPLYKAEKEIIGTTDSLIASRVLRLWQFPANICEGVAHHRTPEQAQPEYIIIAGLTQVAYAISNIAGAGKNGDGAEMEIFSTYFAQRPNLKIADKDIQEKIVSEITATIRAKKDAVSGQTENPHAEKKARIISPSSLEKSKKGMFGWVKSIWK